MGVPARNTDSFVGEVIEIEARVREASAKAKERRMPPVYVNRAPRLLQAMPPGDFEVEDALGKLLDTRQQLLPTGDPDDFFCGQFDDNEIEDKKKAAEDTATKQLWTYHDEVLDTATDDRAYRALRGV